MYRGNWRLKTARISPYDGTEPVILLRPEDMHAHPNHQLTMRISDIYIYHVQILLCHHLGTHF